MRTEVISADTIDEAVEQILNELKEDARSSGRHNVTYFDGWDGLGASAVLRAVHRRLDPAASQENQPRALAGGRAPIPTGLEFSHIFHIDCSKWESRRGMQRVIVQDLMLPPWVMEMIDVQDEDDDYQYVAKGSRAEIPQVAGAICEHIQKLVMNRRFLVIFHNGSNEEIDLNSFGFPLSGYLRNKVLWSFQGRFRVYAKTKIDSALKNARTTTDVVLSASTLCHHRDSALLWEAEDFAEIIVGGTYGCVAARSWLLLMMRLCGMGNRFDDYGLATHGCNYWVCELDSYNIETNDDGHGTDTFWRSAEALYREMRLDEEYYRNPVLPSPVVRRSLEPKSYWSSTTYGFMRVLEPDGWIPKGMFQHFNLLSVLKLSVCIFNVRSPPFLCCNGLRFLQLDHCQGVDRGIDEEVEDDMLRRFLQRLWVLDVRYSNSVFLSGEMMGFMTQLRELNVMGEEDELFDLRILQGRLDNIRKLRVTKSRVMSVPYIFSGRDKLELLELSGNYCTALFSVEISSCSSLETVIMKGSEDLEEISLMGCAKLKNIFLNGSFMYLRTIEIIGAAVETLDLSAVTARDLNRLLVRACGNLRSILWPPAAEGRSGRYLRMVHIDTSTQKEGSATAAAGKEFAWHISVRDARTLGHDVSQIRHGHGTKNTLGSFDEETICTHLFKY